MFDFVTPTELKTCASVTFVYSILALYQQHAHNKFKFAPYDWQTYTSHSRVIQNDKVIIYTRKVVTSEETETIEFTVRHQDESEPITVEEALNILLSRYEIKPTECNLYKTNTLNSGNRVLFTREKQRDKKVVKKKFLSVGRLKKLFGYLSLTATVFCLGKECYGRYSQTIQ
jgi:hypothetical protein